MKLIGRVSFLTSAAAALIAPLVAAASTQDDKRRFIAQCDENISIDRLAGAPFKFVGKKVDLHGTVGQIVDPTFMNFIGNGAAIVVLIDSRRLESGQSLRVLGIVENPANGSTTDGGSSTFAVVRKVYVE